MTKRIVFTGGTGKAGRHAVPHLLAKGYSILNVDLKPLDLPGVNTLVADLTDSGQAFNALTTHFGSMALSAAKRRARRTPLCISRQSRAC
jgi:UDP-glucose 4-epimerase